MSYFQIWFTCLSVWELRWNHFFHQQSKRKFHRQFARMLVLQSYTREIRCVIQLAFTHFVDYFVGAKEWVCMTRSGVKVSADTGSGFYAAFSLFIFNYSLDHYFVCWLYSIPFFKNLLLVFCVAKWSPQSFAEVRLIRHHSRTVTGKCLNVKG